MNKIDTELVDDVLKLLKRLNNHYINRTCENCNHLQEYSAKLWKTIGVCSNMNCSFFDCKVTDTDGCNKWSTKDD